MSNIRDEQAPIAPSGKPALDGALVNSGKVAAVHQPKNLQASVDADTVTFMVEVTSTSSAIGRAGLDLVVVLDVSGSMAEHGKLDKLKSAMQFLLKKLSPMDRLSIVTFSDAATKLTGLRPMDEANQPAFSNIVASLAARGGTNIQAGLEAGLGVLAGRKISSGRTANILLMSDGQETGGNARQAKNPGNVPVYTLGFGKDSDSNLLGDVAKNGGTFNAVPDQGNMVVVFSQLLGGLLTVVVNDLQLIVRKSSDPDAEPEFGKIAKVDAGGFVTEASSDSSEVTVKFGDLFSGEVRKVLVDLELKDAVDKTQQFSTLFLETYLTYLDQNGKRVQETEESISVERIPGRPAASGTDDRRLQLELARRQHADYIKAARALADQKKLEEARDKLVDAQNALEDILDQRNPLVASLKTELKQLLNLVESQELYEAQGRAYALAAEASHANQRFATRGDDVESMRLFATPRMDAYLEQAKQFTRDRNAKLPNADEDTNTETKANPVAALAAGLNYQINVAIQALQNIQKIIATAAANPPSA
ncbi:hypothetical protein ACP70R_000091 [Stipagrostis hirtigluma subsp. patula]